MGEAGPAGVPDQAESHAKAECVIFWADGCASGGFPGEGYDTATVFRSMEVNLLSFSIEAYEQVTASQYF
ncbi:hypothetical protein BG030_12475 [Pseudomonas putida]|nr:hypothetical protein BG030_12475 [Pseudomonas putida]